MREYVLPIAAALALAGAMASAQDSTEPESAPSGPSLMERGVEMFWKGLRDEMGPALENLRGLAEEMGPQMRAFLEEMGPALAGIAAEIEDWSEYEPPEKLPNGDIIIRRKQPEAPDETPPDSEASPDAPSGVTDI